MSGSLRGGSHATPASSGLSLVDGRLEPAPAEPLPTEPVPEDPEVFNARIAAEDAAEVAVPVEEVDLGSHTVAALRVIAQDLDIKNYTDLKKAELIAAIEARETP